MDSSKGGGTGSFMAGSIRERGKGSWQLRVFVGREAVTGRRRYVSKTFHGTKRDAEKELAKLVVSSGQLTPRAASSATLERLLEEWIEHAATDWSPKTAVVVRGYFRDPILPLLGGTQVAKLTTLDLDRFYRHLQTVGGKRGPYKPATVRRVHGILRRALGQAVRWGWISHNPAIDASPPRVPLSVLKPPTPDEVVHLFRTAEEWNPELACFIVLAASTGARRGELVALRWRDVDFRKGTVTIERGLILAGGTLIEQGTKTHQSRRVTIDSTTISTLRAHQARAESNAEAAGTTITGHSFLFSRAVDGSDPWRPDATTRDFRVLCERAGVTGIRLHDLRHYVATRLLASGVDVRTVAGRLGHRNPATTLNVYSHFVPEADQEAAETLGAIFGKALETAELNGCSLLDVDQQGTP